MSLSKTRNNKNREKSVSKYVLMPGGSRLKSHVKKALVKANASRRIIDRLDKDILVNAKANRASLLEMDVHFIRSLVPLSHEIQNPRWVAYAGWNNQTGVPIGSMVSMLRVPEAPVDKYGPSIFIFPGLQSNKLIIQPVLQWGFTGAGGGAFWSIGSCLAGDQSSSMQVSGLTKVKPGTVLKAVIQLRDVSNNKFYYSSYFENYDRSRIETAGLEEMKYCCVTLESYNTFDLNDYPPQQLTTVSGITLTDLNMRPIIPSWQVRPNSGGLGEHAIVRRVPGEDDAIDLYF